MTSRRTKQKRDAKYFEEARNMRHVGTILDRLLVEFRTLSPPVVRTKHSGPFGGAPDNFDVSFVFATRADADRARDAGMVQLATERVRAALRSDGYPSDALATFRFHAISEEEIQDAGGEWMYDRA
jgi:hypothetical protein